MIKKKILFVLDTLQGSGAERSLVEIAIRFKQFIPVFVNIYEGDMLTPILDDHGITYHSLNVPMERNFGIATKRLAKIYELEKPDIIHSTLFKSDAVTRLLKNEYDIFLINSYVNNNYNPLRFEELNYIQGFKMRMVQLYDTITSRKADFFISNSETIKKAKSRATYTSQEKIKVIYRGRDTKRYLSKDVIESDQVLEELGITYNNIVLLNVSRLIQRKGQMDLIDALPEIISEFPEVVLLIAGHGNFKETLEKKIDTLELNSNVKLLGRRQDVPELLEVSDLFIFPSYFEGLPGALIEAMLSEKIIVCSNIPENMECVDKECALFFERGNSSALASKIIYALKNKSELKILGKMARKKAIEKFDIDSIAQEYERTYSQILNNQATTSQNLES